jgi:PIN domain nuclease of toxin-antitoxin system
MMVSKGRINLKIDPKHWLDYSIDNSGLQVTKLSPEIALESCNFPGHFHKDPADRIIVATARTHDMTLLMKDSRIIQYPHVRALW